MKLRNRELRAWQQAIVGTIAAVVIVSGLVASDGARAASSLRLLVVGEPIAADLLQQFTAETAIVVSQQTVDQASAVKLLKSSNQLAPIDSDIDLAIMPMDTMVDKDFRKKYTKAFDLSKMDQSAIEPAIMEQSLYSADDNDSLRFLPYSFSVLGLVVNRYSAPELQRFSDICSGKYHYRVALAKTTETLWYAAFSLNHDAFSKVENFTDYRSIIDQTSDYLVACRPKLSIIYSVPHQAALLMKANVIDGYIGYDRDSLSSFMQNRDIDFVASNGIGSITGFALPHAGRNDAAAYRLMAFLLRPENAARQYSFSYNQSAVRGYRDHLPIPLKAQLEKIFTKTILHSIHWRPRQPSSEAQWRLEYQAFRWFN